ncbi:MAG: tryptophan synthase subunit alpha [Promethearchaeota archaeon]
MTSSNQILELFRNQSNSRKKFFMPFLVAGDPDIEEFKRLAFAIEPYCDMLEIGIPFSDPIADGPTIQEANMRAFKAGTNTPRALNAIKEIHQGINKPIVVLTYYNILIQGADTIEKSLDRTFRALKNSGVEGIVIADLPIEEATHVLQACEKYDILLIFLVAPSTTEERLNKILKKANGFMYLISVLGVTGARETVAQITMKTIKKIKEKTRGLLPILVGFGISCPEHARTILNAGADGIIVGSALINIIKSHLHDYSKMEQKVVNFVSTMKNALKGEK